MGEPSPVAVRSELDAVSAPRVTAAPTTTLTAGTAADRARVSEGEQAFATRLYAQLPHDGNIFFSPTSVRMALAMTYAGARGQTAREMEKALVLQGSPESTHDGFAVELRDLAATGSVHVVNRLWAQKGRTFAPDYLSLLQNDYGAPLTQLDFRGDNDNSRRTINTFIEDNTNHKIKDLLPDGALPKEAKLVLTNAVYFKGDWQEAFKPSDTKDAPFLMAGGRSTSAKLMETTSSFGYGTTSDAQVLELPYSTKAGGDLSMVIVLPKDKDGLSGVESTLQDGSIASWTKSLSTSLVDVVLPRFTMTSEFSLPQQLSKMGMPSAFGGSADFSGMDGTHEISLGAVLHKAFVAVDEKGTEAAAATAVVAVASAVVVQREKVSFRADHPFVFFIRDGAGSVLFMGRVANPSAQG